MRTLFGNSVLRQDDDSLSIPNGGQTMGDDDGCAIFSEIFQ